MTTTSCFIDKIIFICLFFMTCKLRIGFYSLGVLDSWRKRMGYQNTWGHPQRSLHMWIYRGSTNQHGVILSDSAKQWQRETYVPSNTWCWLGLRSSFKRWGGTLFGCHMSWKRCKVHQPQVGFMFFCFFNWLLHMCYALSCNLAVFFFFYQSRVFILVGNPFYKLGC